MYKEIICQPRTRTFNGGIRPFFGWPFLFSLDACVTATWRTPLTLNSQRDTPVDGDVRGMYTCIYSGLEMQMRRFHEFIDANGIIMYDEIRKLFRQIKVDCCK